MTKRKEIKIDEASLVERISTRNRVLKASIPASEPMPEEENALLLTEQVIPDQTEQVEPESETDAKLKTQTSRREGGRRKRGQAENYDEVFLRRKELKTRQSVYISQEVHASIARLVHVLALAGREISVGGYIDNVLTEHLDSHKEVIAEMCRKQLDQFL